jgi:hypothetical protein
MLFDPLQASAGVCHNAIDISTVNISQGPVAQSHRRGLAGSEAELSMLPAEYSPIASESFQVFNDGIFADAFCFSAHQQSHAGGFNQNS